MIRPHPLLKAFEETQLRIPADFRRNLRIVEGLWQEARQLGVLPDRPALDGIESDIRLARAINVYQSSRKDRPSPR